MRECSSSTEREVGCAERTRAHAGEHEIYVYVPPSAVKNFGIVPNIFPISGTLVVGLFLEPMTAILSRGCLAKRERGGGGSESPLSRCDGG